MPIPKPKYKNVSFFSGFSYLYPIKYGYVDSYGEFDDFSQSTVYRINATVSVPNTVASRPPIIKFFVEQGGKFNEVVAQNGLYAGNDSNFIRIASEQFGLIIRQGFYRVHYIIYDRAV